MLHAACHQEDNCISDIHFLVFIIHIMTYAEYMSYPYIRKTE